MTDGTLSVRRRQPKQSEIAAADLPYSAASLKSGAYEAFLGASVPAIGLGTVKSKQKLPPIPDSTEVKVETGRRKRLKDYDKFLKSFKYSAALDSVLKKV